MGINAVEKAIVRMVDFLLGNTLVQFILGLSALIILHELGHFVVARLLGVEVEEFGLGLPPRMLTLFEAGGTEFTLNWLPLGGFVRPKGENDPNVEGGLAAASPWVRLGVLSAGSITNLAVGVLLGIMLFSMLGDPVTEIVEIGSVLEGAPGEMAGLQAGDVILSVNETEIDSTEKLQSVVEENAGQEITLRVRRDGEVLSVQLIPRVDAPEDEGAIGIALIHPTRPIDFGTAVVRGIDATYQQVRGLLLLPVRLLTGEASPEEGRFIGYKGLYDIYTIMPSRIYFFMVISISLGVLNLLPIPALDGGRMLLTLPEILFGRRVPPRYENMIHLIGFTLLILLILYINIQDFINPIELP